MWEAIVLSSLILVGFGTAILLTMRKHKAPKVTIVRQEVKGVDIEELAIRVATAVAETMEKKLLDKLDRLGYTADRSGRIINEDGQRIEMDESIIPMAVDAAVDHVNLDNMAQEEETEDKGLAASKNKLARLKKNG